MPGNWTCSSCLEMLTNQWFPCIHILTSLHLTCKHTKRWIFHSARDACLAWNETDFNWQRFWHSLSFAFNCFTLYRFNTLHRYIVDCMQFTVNTPASNQSSTESARHFFSILIAGWIKKSCENFHLLNVHRKCCCNHSIILLSDLRETKLGLVHHAKSKNIFLFVSSWIGNSFKLHSKDRNYKGIWNIWNHYRSAGEAVSTEYINDSLKWKSIGINHEQDDEWATGMLVTSELCFHDFLLVGK